MNILKSFIVIAFLCIGLELYAVIPEKSGWWKFDISSDLSKAETGFGLNLSAVGTMIPESGPVNGNGAVLAGIGSYFKMHHSILPNGSGSKINEYTLQYDFKIPSNTVWHSFFQTNPANSDDGDLFINPSGNIGVAAVGYSNYSVLPNEWYRLIISVKNGTFFNCYLDGNLLMTGNIQAVDGRFALAEQLLIFADNDKEDASIYCSELAIWNKALTAEQAKELGGFGHVPGSFLMTRIPYLQGQGPNSMNICWHDTAETGTKVDYGTDSTLNRSTTGTSELISTPYRWHSVKLTGLKANTRYFYNVFSGGETSGIYSFKTLPDDNYTGKLRFVLFSDTHATDTLMAGKVQRAARDKIKELYGSDIENHVNGIFHSGDLTVSGNSAGQYTTQYFKPLSAMSPYIPTMAVAGNHEGENQFFYQYMKLDDQSVYPKSPSLNEKMWQLKIGNSLFIGLNTNIISQYGKVEADWVDTRLNEAEQDAAIDFVFLFFHHPPFSELWFDVSTFDDGANYVKDVLFPVFKKYTKVQQIHTGHTHGFERGTILSDKVNSDFRIVCGGGGGGPLDLWGAFTNYDYPDIQIAIDNYCFQVLEIDVANHSYQSSMYSLGTLNKSRNSELMDRWYKKINQSEPNTPVAYNPVIKNENIEFNTSEFSGVDSLMSVQLIATIPTENSAVAIDTIVHWTNIYDVDKNYNPVDKNKGIDLYHLSIQKSVFNPNKTYVYQVRYRDQNLKWSEWSNTISFKTDGLNSVQYPENKILEEFSMSQNSPNPFQKNTTISYRIPELTTVIFRIYDKTGKLIEEINEGLKPEGNYQLKYKSDQLTSDIYFYKMITKKSILTKKMLKIE